MQDYPQHLVQAHMLYSHNDSGYDFSENFTFNMRGPYITFFVLTDLFSIFLPVETAGKVTLSLYILLISLLIMKISERISAVSAPWGLFFFFPFAFNQQYFLGGVNYLFSIPILIFALIDHEDLTTGSFSNAQILRHFLWQAALFFTHPFTFLIYIALSAAGSVFSYHKGAGLKQAICPTLAALLILFAWFIAQNLQFNTGGMGEFSVQGFKWSPLRMSAIYYGLMFTGMRWFDGADKPAVVIWISLLIILIISFFSGAEEKQGRISNEIDEVLPVIEKIPSNSKILPLIFDNDSPEVDSYFFDIHLHDYFYYHLLIGGGFTPYFLTARIHPVHYRRGAERPAPGVYEPWLFRWETHASDYQYFLVRGGPRSEFISYMAGKAYVITGTKNWLLLKRTD